MPPHVNASKYVSVSLRVAEAAAASPRGPLSVWKPKGLKAEDAKQMYLLASCRLEANCQNNDTDRIYKKISVLLLPYFSVSYSVSVEFF